MPLKVRYVLRPGYFRAKPWPLAQPVPPDYHCGGLKPFSKPAPVGGARPRTSVRELGMKRKMVLAASMSLVAGCSVWMQAQGVPPVQPITDCTSSSCTVQLAVDQNCKVTDPGTLRVTKKDAKITWTASNPNVRFGTKGIEIKDPPPGNIFTDDPNNPNDRKKFSINNKNQKKNGDATNYKYIIRLEGIAGCTPVDPVVMNDCTDPGC